MRFVTSHSRATRVSRAPLREKWSAWGGGSFCFADSDHLMLPMEFAFCLSWIMANIPVCTSIWKKPLSGLSSRGLKWENKTLRLKRSISFCLVRRTDCRSELSMFFALVYFLVSSLASMFGMFTLSFVLCTNCSWNCLISKNTIVITMRNYHGLLFCYNCTLETH